MCWRVFTLVFMLSAVPHSGLAALQCLEYDDVTLTGTLVRQTYPGPPDYESVTKGDAPRVIWVLLLDYYVCAVDSDPRYPKEYNEREIELALEDQQYERYRGLLGRRVVVTGTLAPGGAKHEKRLVLGVIEMQQASVLLNRP